MDCNEKKQLIIFSGIFKEGNSLDLYFYASILPLFNGDTIFLMIQIILQSRNINIYRMISISAYGAPVMIGNHDSFVAKLSNINNNIISLNCVSHRVNLIEKVILNFLN